MKNRTESGMHFDQSTAEKPLMRNIDFEEGGCSVRLTLVVTERIESKLSSADYDELRLMLAKRFVQIATGVPIGMRLDHRRMMDVLRMEGANFLYNRFIFAQAREGNDVWQAPPQMTRIGPSPEEDDRYGLQAPEVVN